MNVLPSSLPESRTPEKEFTAFDRVFGDFLCRRAGNGEDALRALGMELVFARREGHSFLSLSPEEAALLEKYPCLTDENKGLLVREKDRLYLRREFLNEAAAARAIARLLKEPPLPLPAGCTDEEIDRICGKKLNCEQHLAVRNALSRFFALISGGPGTGKSTILAAVAELELRRDPRSIIRIAAPTGKAAELLTRDLKSVLPDRDLTASTLHKLFNIRSTGEFGVNGENPLECDLLIVDECSMVSLSLAANMFRGLRPGTRVVLAGDHRQLESIESGAVLSELLSARKTAPDSPLARAGVELTENFRSLNAPGIQGLAREIREGTLPPEELCAHLASGASPDLEFLHDGSRFRKEMRAAARRCWEGLPRTASDCREEQVKKAFAQLNSFRVLSANRVGAGGCVELNKMIMEELALPSQYAPGSALMVTRNSPATGLANGDVGIVFAAAGGGVKVLFENVERPFAPHELPPHEGAFATTVHKAQGSGFKEVFFLLPGEDSPLLTRELFYTGLTRAKEKITVAGSRETVTGALSRSSRRRSGLARRIVDFLKDEKNGL